MTRDGDKGLSNTVVDRDLDINEHTSEAESLALRGEMVDALNAGSPRRAPFRPSAGTCKRTCVSDDP